jgi:hypothetical protein
MIVIQCCGPSIGTGFCEGGELPSSKRLNKSERMQKPTYTKQQVCAIGAVFCNIPVKPNIAKTNAMTNEYPARFNMQ